MRRPNSSFSSTSSFSFLFSFLFVFFLFFSCSFVDAKFPKGFMWGTATASYQVEGAHDVDGRGPSIWDVFSHTPGKIIDGTNGDHADDHYHRVEEDVKLMVDLGVKVFRFSISWSRILPTGELPVNPAGIAYYNKLIDTLLANGIEPFITLYHWDLPQALEARYGGWLNSSSADWFALYAEITFQAYGDRVKYWLTFNEPHSFTVSGYHTGFHAPGRCSNRLLCPEGNSSTEPYIVAHNVLRSHAKAVEIFRKKYSSHDSKIGITLDSPWLEPLNPESELDKEATERALIFHLGWYADPVYFGDYPEVMKERVGKRLPSFTEEEKILLKGSSDFFGLNHYWSNYAFHTDNPEGEGYFKDRGCYLTPEKDGELIGPKADSGWFFVVPRGMRGILNWVWKRYNNPDIYITENGVDVPNESLLPLQEALNDTFRVNFYRDYLSELEKAIVEDGVKVLGYMAWSLLDNFEWADGYEKRFGLYYVDYKDNMKRYPKRSVSWFRDYIKSSTDTSYLEQESK